MPTWNSDTGSPWCSDWEFFKPRIRAQVTENLPKRITDLLSKCLFKYEGKEGGREERTNQATAKATGKTLPPFTSRIRIQAGAAKVDTQHSPSLELPSLPALGAATYTHHHQAASKASCFTKCFPITTLPTPSSSQPCGHRHHPHFTGKDKRIQCG